MDADGDAAARGEVLSLVSGQTEPFWKALGHPSCPTAGALTVGADFLTIFAAPHGRAEDSLVLSVVERVAIPVHRMVEQREVPTRKSVGQKVLWWWGRPSSV